MTAQKGPQVPDELLFRVVEALDAVAAEVGKTVPQVALNWVLQRPSVATAVYPYWHQRGEFSERNPFPTEW